MTERKLAEQTFKQQLHFQNSPAGNAGESVSSLHGDGRLAFMELVGIAHDVNNLLTINNGYAAVLLAQESLDSENAPAPLG